MKRLFILCSLLLTGLASGCIEDMSEYDCLRTNRVTFLDGSFSFTAGEEASLTAPVAFSEEVADPDALFDIVWFIDRKPIASGYRIVYTFPRSGSFSLYLKVTNRETGETYLSDSYAVTTKSAFDWGWMVLSDQGDGQSSLSFISPVSLFVSHHLEREIEGGLGSDPRNLFYYNIFGTVPNFTILGLPKVLVNQGSGSVTLDGSTLQKDMWLRDEFGGAEPADLHIAAFGWNRPFYAICTEEGDLYIRDIDDYKNQTNAYYGRYTSLPREFENGAKITCFQGFPNPLYLAADVDGAMAYDEKNARFIALTKGNAENRYNAGTVYLNNYDLEYTLPAGVRPVNDLGAGTRCLGIGAYQYYGASTSGSTFAWSKYVALLDLGGSGDYSVYTFSLDPLSWENHVVKESTQTPFSGGGVMTAKSLVQMSSNFDEHPFFYFTDGGRNLYIYSMETRTHRLAYTASSPITRICPSPIVCYFKEFGANSTEPNFRLALSGEDGSVSIVDVSYAKLVELFSGMSPDVEIARLEGFGDVKGMVWCTNLESEY